MQSAENRCSALAACSARSILFCSVRFNMTFSQSERLLESLQAFL
jgi:hypothetical protein